MLFATHAATPSHRGVCAVRSKPVVGEDLTQEVCAYSLGVINSSACHLRHGALTFRTSKYGESELSLHDRSAGPEVTQELLRVVFVEHSRDARLQFHDSPDNRASPHRCL